VYARNVVVDMPVAGTVHATSAQDAVKWAEGQLRTTAGT
jgi:hypothetical protein